MSKAVAEVITNTRIGGVINKAYPVGTKLYTTDHAEELANLLAEAVADQDDYCFGPRLLSRINEALTNYREATK